MTTKVKPTVYVYNPQFNWLSRVQRDQNYSMDEMDRRLEEANRQMDAIHELLCSGGKK